VPVPDDSTKEKFLLEDLYNALRWLFEGALLGNLYISTTEILGIPKSSRVAAIIFYLNPLYTVYKNAKQYFRRDARPFLVTRLMGRIVCVNICCSKSYLRTVAFLHANPGSYH
jgi:hypothetical protein